MDIVTIILSAAKAIGVSGTLLLAICNHESAGFKYDYAPFDVGSPSIGFCQLKYSTSLMFNFSGTPNQLMDPKINSKYAARYLKYQQDRYGDNWVQITAAYNAGSFLPSKNNPTCPRNIKYIKRVQKKLPEEFQERLNCGTFGELAENP